MLLFLIMGLLIPKWFATKECLVSVFSGRLYFKASGRAVVPGGAQPRWRHAEGRQEPVGVGEARQPSENPSGKNSGSVQSLFWLRQTCHGTHWNLMHSSPF
jgi:hypothetical protein